MIDVSQAIQGTPKFETFCSVDRLHRLIDELRQDSRFAIELIGASMNGLPLHHIRFGRGEVKALFVGGPHAPEPIGSVTVYALLNLLQQGSGTLLKSNVEWHVVPCIDPDGARLNEGWTQHPFDVARYVRGYYVQPPADQVDFSFPIAYKGVEFTSLSREATALRALLDRVRPDFLYSLHNSQLLAGGAWFATSRDLGANCYKQLEELLDGRGIPLQVNAFAGRWFRQFSGGMVEMPSTRKYIDYFLEHGIEVPKALTQGSIGASSGDYLLDINKSALTFATELTYCNHPDCSSDRNTAENLQDMKLRVDADNNALARTIVDEWIKVERDLDARSPFYKKLFTELIALRECLLEGSVALWTTIVRQDILIANEGDQFRVYAERIKFLGNAYAFVRLLESSRQSRLVKLTMGRVRERFEEALEHIASRIPFSAFEIIQCGKLADVQLGGGLIALNFLLEARQSSGEIA
jgi:hypothetical protein